MATQIAETEAKVGTQISNMLINTKILKNEFSSIKMIYFKFFYLHIFIYSYGTHFEDNIKPLLSS